MDQEQLNTHYRRLGKEVGWGENRGARRLLRCFMNTSWIMSLFWLQKGLG